MIDLVKRLLFVRKCICCGEILTELEEDVFCPNCKAEYEKLKRRFCHICGKQHCACGCLPSELIHDVSWAVHLLAYEASFSKTLIFALKRRDFKPLQRFLGEELVRSMPQIAEYDITYAPRKPKSVRKYGFDQAEAIANVISEKLELPLVKLFRHAERSDLQKDLNFEERKENAEKSYTICKRFRRQHENLVIVDDVITSGSTMAKLISLAKEAGYRNVAVVYVARTAGKRKTYER